MTFKIFLNQYIFIIVIIYCMSHIVDICIKIQIPLTHSFITGFPKPLHGLQWNSELTFFYKCSKSAFVYFVVELEVRVWGGKRARPQAGLRLGVLERVGRGWRPSQGGFHAWLIIYYYLYALLNSLLLIQ